MICYFFEPFSLQLFFLTEPFLTVCPFRCVFFFILAVVRGQFDCLAIYIICVFFVTNQFRRVGGFVSFPLDGAPAKGDIPIVNRQWIQNRISDWIEIIYLVCVEYGANVCDIWKIPLHSIWNNPIRCSLDFPFAQPHRSHQYQRNTSKFMNSNGIINIFNRNDFILFDFFPSFDVDKLKMTRRFYHQFFCSLGGFGSTTTEKEEKYKKAKENGR